MVKDFLLIIIILLTSVILDYTLVPKLIAPLNNLNFSTLSFVHIAISKSNLLPITIIIAGISKDILSTFPFGLYTLIFLIIAFFIQYTSKLILKENLITKSIYIALAIIGVNLIPNFGRYTPISSEIIFKKVGINIIFFLFWHKILSYVTK